MYRLITSSVGEWTGIVAVATQYVLGIGIFWRVHSIYTMHIKAMKLCELSSVETNCYFKQINQGLRENFRFTIDLLKIMLCIYGVVGCCILPTNHLTLIHILKTTAYFLFQIKTSLIWYSPWFCRFACLLFFASENLRLLLLFFSCMCVWILLCRLLFLSALFISNTAYSSPPQAAMCNAGICEYDIPFFILFSSVLFKFFFSCMFCFIYFLVFWFAWITIGWLSLACACGSIYVCISLKHGFISLSVSLQFIFKKFSLLIVVVGLFFLYLLFFSNIFL